MPGVNIGTPSNAGLYSGTATPIMNGASQGSNYMASYPDATGQLMSRTQAENATKNYLGTIDGITPTAEDQKSYTDKTYLELFDGRDSKQVTWLVRENFEKADSSWHFDFAPIMYSSTLEQTDYIVEVNRSMMDRTAPQGLPTFVSMKHSAHLTKLKQFIKGLEIDGEAFFNSPEGNDSFFKYVLGIAQAALITAKASIAAGILGTKDYYLEWRAKYGNASDAANAYQAAADEIVAFGLYSYNKKAIYQSAADAETVGASEGVVFNMLVVPPGRLKTLAFSEFESDSASIRGTGKQESRLTTPVASWRRELPNLTIYEDMIFDLHDQEPFSLSLQTVWIGRAFMLDGTSSARSHADNYDAINDGRIAYVSVSENCFLELSIQKVESESIYFDTSDAAGTGPLSPAVQEFADALNNDFKGTMSELGLQAEVGSYVHPYLYYDDRTMNKQYKVCQVNGQRTYESAPRDHAVLHGKMLRQHIIKSGKTTAVELGLLERAKLQLRNYGQITKPTLESLPVQAWLLACAANAGVSDDGTCLNTNRLGGIDLPPTMTIGTQSNVLAVSVNGELRPVYISGQTVGISANTTLPGGARAALVPGAPIGFSEPVQFATLAEYYTSNQSDLGGYKAWVDIFESLSRAYTILETLYVEFESTYGTGSSFDSNNLPRRFRNTVGDESAARFATFLHKHMSSDLPILEFSSARLSLTSAAGGAAAGRGASAGGVVQRVGSTRVEVSTVPANRPFALLGGDADAQSATITNFNANVSTILSVEAAWPPRVRALLLNAIDGDLDAQNSVSIMVQRFETSNGESFLNFLQSSTFGAPLFAKWSAADLSVDNIVDVIMLMRSAFDALQASNVNTPSAASILAAAEDNSAVYPVVATWAEDERALQSRRVGTTGVYNPAPRGGGGAEEADSIFGVADGDYTIESPLSLTVLANVSASSVARARAHVATERVNTNSTFEERLADLSRVSDFVTRLGAKLWLESPITLAQRRALLSANLPYDTSYVVIQPDMKFVMAPDIFLVRGKGELRYSMPTSLLTYDKMHNKIYVRATIWMGFRNPVASNVLIFPHRHYISYGGGAGEVVFYTADHRADYDCNVNPTGAENAFLIDVGLITRRDLPQYFSIQGKWSSKYFNQGFRGLESSSTLQKGLRALPYFIWYWKMQNRNSDIEPTRESYATMRDQTMLNVAVGFCVQKDHVAGTSEWHQTHPSSSLTKEIGPGCRNVMDGSGDMMPNERFQAYHMHN